VKVLSEGCHELLGPTQAASLLNVHRHAKRRSSQALGRLAVLSRTNGRGVPARANTLGQFGDDEVGRRVNGRANRTVDRTSSWRWANLFQPVEAFVGIGRRERNSRGHPPLLEAGHAHGIEHDVHDHSLVGDRSVDHLASRCAAAIRSPRSSGRFKVTTRS